MEERHKAINDLITKIALGNSDISREQITRARAMYSGDTRPLEEIEKELLSYSEEISANKRMAERPIPKKESDNEVIQSLPKDQIGETIQPEQPSPTPQPIKPYQSESTIQPMQLDPEQLAPQVESGISFGNNSDSDIKAKVDKNQEHDGEMDSMFAEYDTIKKDYMPYRKEIIKETPKQLVKDAPVDNGGYGNVTAILTVAAMLSIMTIIMAVFTILAS